MTDYLLLKWGTIKSIRAESDEMKAKVEEIDKIELCWRISTMIDPMSDAKRKAICELIDSCQGEIRNDWSGEVYTKDQAKAYIMEYRAC